MSRRSSDPTIENTSIVEGTIGDEVSQLQGRMNQTEAKDPKCRLSAYIKHEVDNTDRQNNTSGLNLSEYYINRIIDAMEARYSKPREGYHVTDVCFCPRQKVFRQIDHRPIGAKTVSIYSAGKAIHEAVQWLFLNDKRTFEREKYLEYQDIQGSVDLYDRKRNIPLEFKTCRVSDLKEPKTFHVEQLKYYMAMLDVPQGYMLYQFLLHFGDKPFKGFKIMMDGQERYRQRIKLVREIYYLKRAMEAGDPALARPVSDDASLNWLCKECPYLTDCKKIQDSMSACYDEFTEVIKNDSKGN